MFGRKKTEAASTSSLGSIAYMPGSIFDLMIASVFINVLALAMPLTLLQVYDRIIPNSADETLILLIVGVGSALVLEAFLRMGRSYVSGWMGARFEHLAGCAAIDRLFGASILDFEVDGAGTHLERFNALSQLKEFYAGQAILALCDLPFAAIYLGAIAYLAGPLVLVPIVLIVAFALFAMLLGRRIRRSLESRSLADDRRFSFIIEVLGGIHTVKGLAMEEQMIRRYERLQETCADADYRVTLHSSSAQSLGAVFSQLVLFMVVGFGSTLVIDGLLTVGGLAACTMLAGRSMQPLQKAVGIWTRFQSIQLARERLRKLFDMRVERRAGLPDLPEVRGRIDVTGATFTFGKDAEGDETPPLFENINIHIEPGETVAISGANASGKSTLLYLMMGVLSPTSGTVRFDGYDLQDFEPSSIRRQAAYLPQEGVLYNGTLMDNLTMFRDEKRDDALDMCRIMALDNVVAQMPEGYETNVGEGASDKLPRGIVQRIAIARALVDKPRILLFDEANTSMDGSGDAMLRAILERLKGRVTLVMVSQRPSMLSLADRIFEIDGSNLQERQPQAPAVAPPPASVVPA